MYRIKKFNRNARAANSENESRKRPLNTIDEDTTIKLTRRNSAAKTNDGKEPDLFEKPTQQSSEETLPASQELCSQRFISQRSQMVAAGLLTRTLSSNLSARMPSTNFEIVLTKAGVLLGEGENFVLSCDHVTFVAKFRNILQSHPNYPDNIENFKIGLRDALDPKSPLALKLHSGCTISATGEEHIYQSQDSMIVNFLMIDFLCDHVLEVLLEKIELVACDRAIATNGNIVLLPLMLAQLRYAVPSHGDAIYDRIKIIYEKATNAGKSDIIANAELILEASKHNEFVQMLLDTMECSEDIFNRTTITALTNLCLSAEMQGKLRCKTLAYLENNQNQSSNLLPMLIKLLLKILNEDNDIYMRELVDTLRRILLLYSRETAGVLDKTIQLDLFNYLEQGLTRSKKFYTIWQKTIATLRENRFRSVDFIILLMLTHIKEDNSLYIENILRRRIKNENLSLEIINAAKAKFPAVLEKYTLVLMYILHDFLREKHIMVANFARSSYSVLFEICESVQRSILKKLLELTCDKSAQNMTNISLELLKNLQQKHPREIQNWGMLLMPLLDRLNDMTLSQTRFVMELLCTIAYPPPTFEECPALQDQIDLLVKKQMINRSPIIKKQGIIGCAQLIDCIARVEESCTETEGLNASNIFSVNDLPEGRGKMSAELFQRVQSATQFCPESLALFYDEFASISLASMNERGHRGHLNKPFLLWLCETMTAHFETCFTTDEDPDAINDIPLSPLKCINTAEDAYTDVSINSTLSIAIKISELVLKPTNEASSSVLALAPTFNLLRVLYLQRSEGSLELINALLGCAIILPTFFDEANDAERIFKDYDIDTQKKIVDIYFHCVNWMRVIVGSFITQREVSIKNKVLRRLAELIQIEGKIRKLLHWMPMDYMPPKSQFISTHAPATCKPTRGKPAATKTHGKAKTQQPESEMTLCNETMANNTVRMDNTIRSRGGGAKSSVGKIDFEKFYGPKEVYRQMDMNIMLLLREELSLEMPLPADQIGCKIGLPELHFTLMDLVSKLESITGVQKLHTEENLQYIAKPQDFIGDLSTFLKDIYENIEKIAKAINEQLKKVNNVYSNTDLFTPEFCYLRVCFDLSFRLLAAYFSWPDFTDESKSKLLTNSLVSLIPSSKSSRFIEESLAVIIAEVFNELLIYESSIVDLKTALHLQNLLVTLRRLGSLKDVETDLLNKQALEIRTICRTFMQRKWYGYDSFQEKGARFNICLDEFVKGFLKNSDFKRQREILNLVLEEVKHLKGKDYIMRSFPNFKRANFAILYRGLCETLLNSMSDIVASQRNTTGDRLRPWEVSCDLLNKLLQILHTLDFERIFQIFLKYSHLYIKLVLQYGISDMEEYIRRNSERVHAFLKHLQTFTRYMHNLCCTSKANKNTAIVNQTPFLRETVETFVYRVKALFAANKCASVFTMANLKNKDIHGDELYSQSTTNSAEDIEEEEEIPEDDSTVCESILEPDEQVSNIYVTINNGNGSVNKTSSLSNCF